MTERRSSLVLAAMLVLAATTASAGMFRWVDEQGNVTYSDRPPQPRDSGAAAPEAKPAADLKVPESKASDLKTASPKTAEGMRRDAKATMPPLVAPRTGATKIDELLELSGARAQLVGLVARVAADLRPAPGQMNASDMTMIERVLVQSLRPDAVYGAVRDAFIPQVDRASLETTASWLRTPAGRKIIALEIASSQPAAEQKIVEYTAIVKSNPPPARRLELLQRLDWVTGANETSADLVAAIARGLSAAVSAAGPPEKRLRPGQIEERAEQVRARANETLREVRTMSMLYTYQSLNDDELLEYVRFSGTDAGRWYNTAMRKALIGAIGKAVEQTATELVRAVPLERWARTAMPAPQPVK
jgi:hypothetical protein